MHKKLTLAAITLGLVLGAGLAANQLVFSQALAATPEPEITIREEADRQVEEYRINGQLYAIKITPKNGPAYYLVDSDGTGKLEERQERGKLLIPSWILLKW